MGMSDVSAHDDAIREQFRLQAETWTDDRRFATAGLDWIVARLAPRPDDQVLDVAAGAGHVGRALTSAGATVTGAAGRDNPLELEDWLERTQTRPAVRAEIRERFDRELDGGAPTGLRPARGPDGTVSFTHTWAAVLAAR